MQRLPGFTTSRHGRIFSLKRREMRSQRNIGRAIWLIPSISDVTILVRAVQVRSTRTAAARRADLF